MSGNRLQILKNLVKFFRSKYSEDFAQIAGILINHNMLIN